MSTTDPPGPALTCPGCGSRDVDLRRGPLCGACATTGPPVTGDTPGVIAEEETPWNADRLGAVLTTAVYEHFVNRLGPFTFSAYGRDEEYEMLDGEPDDDVLTFERKADGVRFDVEFWVNVSPGVSERAS